jgi:ubiquinol-cytochrome c reductase cytochrome c1 subunit
MTRAAILALALFAGFGAQAAEGPAVPAQKWSFKAPFGVYDRAELQRGYQVVSEICASCHTVSLLRYRNLAEIGFSAAEVKAIAAAEKVQDGPNDKGEMFERTALPHDPFKKPFANEQAARAAFNGAYPPDLSLMAKARPNGPDYLHALMTGYGDAPSSVKMGEGLHYNKFFPGGQIAMPPPLADGQVNYTDGTKATVDRMSRDVTVFLMWTAEPRLEDRHRLGLKVILFLVVLTGFFIVVKRKVWASLH